MDLRSTGDHVRRHPGMWFGRSDATYDTCAAFLLGWDTATGGTALAGFEEWLIARAGPQWSSFHWMGLVPVVVRGDWRVRDLTPDDEAALVDGFWALVDEFLGERDATT